MARTQKDRILIEFVRSYAELYQEIGYKRMASQLQAGPKRRKRQSSSPANDSALYKYLNVRTQLQAITNEIRRYLGN